MRFADARAWSSPTAGRKGKPGASRGRKATGLGHKAYQLAGLPKLRWESLMLAIALGIPKSARARALGFLIPIALLALAGFSSARPF